MRHDGAVARLMGHLNRAERLGQSADLVDLDEDGIGNSVLDSLAETSRIGDEYVVADELACVPDRVGQQFPAFHVVLTHAVLDRFNGILPGETGKIFDLLLLRSDLPLASVAIGTLAIELACRAVQREYDIAAGRVTGLGDCGD